MSRKKVLVVEDEVTSRKILSLALEEKECELVFSCDGEDAVEKTLEHRPDLIIMDIMLPRISGFEATRRIKGTPELAHIPIIALTARTMDFDEEQAREAGCDDYLTKPFRVGELRARVHRFLEE